MRKNEDNQKDIFDEFIETFEEDKSEGWRYDMNKKKCPECHSLHKKDSKSCKVCGWNL